MGKNLAEEILKNRAKSGPLSPVVRITSGWTKKVDARFSESVLAFIKEQNEIGDHLSLQRIHFHLKSLPEPIILSISIIRLIKETAVQLRDRLLIHFSKITKRQLISVWKKALNACQGDLAAAAEQEQEGEVLDIEELEMEELEVEE